MSFAGAGGGLLPAPSSSTPDRLLLALLDPACYPHPAGPVERTETHISWVFLAGDYAYKIKKPVDLGFLDFRSLDARRFYCETELRLNRRSAPGLYLEVVPVTESPSGPRIGETGTVLEYALKMRRFPQEALADYVARRGELRASDADALAAVVAEFHAGIPAAPPTGEYGSPGNVIAPPLQNFDELAELASDPAETARLEELRAWTRAEGVRLRGVFTARKRQGFVRECHGDLHLGNIVLLDGRPVLFDCIEFSAALRWIDVMNEVAFLVMDLLEHGLRELAWRFLNAYLETTGDYAGTRVLRYYLVYRALVRAKVALIRARQPGADGDAKERARRKYGEYVALARSLTVAAPAIVLMHGFAGSGKTTVAQGLIERLGAIRVRSDVERKRLHRLAADARTHVRPYGGIYAPGNTRLTYERLRQVARDVVESGYGVVVDAAFLRHAEREAFRELARDLGAPFLIVSCRASEATLRDRVERREAAGRDASEADVAVLESQIAMQDRLGADELAHAAVVDSEWGEARRRKAVDEIARRLAAPKGVRIEES